MDSRKVAREISTTFTDTKVNNYYFSIYHTSWKNSAKNYFISENKLKNDQFFEFCALLNAWR